MAIAVRPEENQLLSACMRADVQFLRKFVEDYRDEKDFAVVDADGWSPLHWAVHSGSFECVEILLSSKRVSLSVKNDTYDTCLDFAIFQKCVDIFRLLLKSDPDFYLIRNFTGKNSMSVEMVEITIDTLKEMNFPFPNGLDFLNKILPSLRFPDDTDKSKIKKTFKKVIGLVDDTADDFMQRIYEAFLQSPVVMCPSFLHWCIAKWHLSKENEHCDLVQQLMNHPEWGVNRFFIFCLHSGIRYLYIAKESKRTDIYLCQFYEDMMKTFVEILDYDVLRNIVAIVMPKVEERWINFTYQSVLYENRANERVCNKMMSYDWLNVTKIGMLLNIRFFQFRSLSEVRAILHVIMPFSTAISADEYLACIKRKLQFTKSILEENMKKSTGDQEVFQRLELKYLNVVEALEKLHDDEDIAKFCVSGDHRKKCTLQSLCRYEIRKSLLQDTYSSYSTLVESTSSLELSIIYENYLLYKYNQGTLAKTE